MIYLGLILFNVMLVASCGYAAGRGGAPERVMAALLIAAALGTALVPLNRASSFQQTETAILAIDLVLLGAMIWVAATADRFWPIWVAGVQLFTVATHLARALNPAIWSRVYWLVTSHTADLIFILLALGTLRHQERLRAGATEYDWSGQRRYRVATADRVDRG